MRLSTFKDVEARYNEIRPLVSVNCSREQDIRPISDRRRRYERIAKISDHEYALHDMASSGSITRLPMYSGREIAAPITWRHNHGVETVTVRGATTDYDTTRYNFLRRYLPGGLYFNVGQSGQHTVGGHYLPRPRGRGDQTDYKVRFTSRPDRVWVFDGPEWSADRSYVDKDRKAALKGDLTCFLEWVCSVGNMLPVHDWQYMNRLDKELREAGVERYQVGKDADSRFGFTAPLALQIIKDYNHPLRIHLAANFLVRANIKGVETAEDNRRFRAKYNSWANRMFGLVNNSRGY